MIWGPKPSPGTGHGVSRRLFTGRIVIGKLDQLAPSHVPTVFATTYDCATPQAGRDACFPAEFPILIYTGASFTVAGVTWLGKWNPELIATISYIGRPFRFGDVESQDFLGAANLATRSLFPISIMPPIIRRIARSRKI